MLGAAAGELFDLRILAQWTVLCRRHRPRRPACHPIPSRLLRSHPTLTANQATLVLGVLCLPRVSFNVEFPFHSSTWGMQEHPRTGILITARKTLLWQRLSRHTRRPPLWAIF